MAAHPIKEKRLSEDSTASSDASVSVSIESADGSGVNTDDSSVGSAPTEKTADELAAEEEEEKYVTWLESDPTIAGRYTDGDPNYANNRERLTPPLLLDYNPRVYNRGGRGRGGGGGGRQDNYQNRGRGQGNYGQSSRNEHQPYQRHHNNQQGRHGLYPNQQRQPEQGRSPERRKFNYGEVAGEPPRKRPAPTAPSYHSEESD